MGIITQLRIVRTVIGVLFLVPVWLLVEPSSKFARQLRRHALGKFVNRLGGIVTLTHG